MLIDFAVGNYLSFRDEVSFSLLAARSVKEHAGEDSPEDDNTIPLPGGKDRLLKCAAVYGANGSGKSNLLKCLAHIRQAVLTSSADDNVMARLSENHYRFAAESETKPSWVELTFFVEETTYRYGFEFLKGTVTQEWLFKKPAESRRESYCFKRIGKTVEVNAAKWPEARGVAKKMRSDALFLSTCAQFDVREALMLKGWFRKSLLVLTDHEKPALQHTVEVFEHDAELKATILDFIRLIDLGIRNIEIQKTPLPTGDETVAQLKRLLSAAGFPVPSGILNRVEIFAEHDVYADGKKQGTLRMPFEAESEGTQQIFALAGLWFGALRSGATLLVDEFGASLHTKLAVELVKLFLQPCNVTAQLVVATHDTHLLRKDLLRRDQIWFTEKALDGASDLYSLVEYRINQSTAVRNDASFGKDYLAGKYGAIPYFGNVTQFIKDFYLHDL